MNIVQAYASNKETLPIAVSAYENVISLKQQIQELFDLFYLKLHPKMHSALLRLVTSVGKLDTHPHAEELKQILASHASFIQRIYKDFACL